MGWGRRLRTESGRGLRTEFGKAICTYIHLVIHCWREIHIKRLGQLVRFIQPPVTGTLAPSRLHLVSRVPCVRAGRSCAGARETLFLWLGIPGSGINVLCVRCNAFGANILCAGMRVLVELERFSIAYEL
jgi:hypothetical protein